MNMVSIIESMRQMREYYIYTWYNCCFGVCL